MLELRGWERFDNIDVVLDGLPRVIQLFPKRKCTVAPVANARIRVPDAGLLNGQTGVRVAGDFWSKPHPRVRRVIFAQLELVDSSLIAYFKSCKF